MQTRVCCMPWEEIAHNILRSLMNSLLSLLDYLLNSSFLTQKFDLSANPLQCKKSKVSLILSGFVELTVTFHSDFPAAKFSNTTEARSYAVFSLTFMLFSFYSQAGWQLLKNVQFLFWICYIIHLKIRRQCHSIWLSFCSYYVILNHLSGLTLEVQVSGRKMWRHTYGLQSYDSWRKLWTSVAVKRVCLSSGQLR